MEPYRLLFPLGVAYAIAGALVWTVAALGWMPYPGPLHRALMIQGFEQSFVVGFLLTALPGLTHSERCRPAELAAGFAAMAAFGVFAFGGWLLGAQIAGLAALLTLVVAAARRLGRRAPGPAEELLFVAFGLLAGLAGGALLAAQAAGAPAWGPPRFAERLLSLGMVLSLVLGVGGLLVPTFAGMRGPLVIPGVAGPHERGPRRALYLSLIAVFVAAFTAEFLGRAVPGALLRAAAASALGLLVWKLFRLPGRRALSSFAMWGAGWLVIAGLWWVAADPARPMAGLHVVFLGGFGLLTFAIATRVVVAHGGHGIAAEPVVLGPGVVTLLALGLIARLWADFQPAVATMLLGASGALWAAGWALWGWRALPRIARTAPPPRPAPAPIPVASITHASPRRG